MANNCEYVMRVKGASKDVDSFVTLIQAEYDEVPKHFWRVFTADVMSYDDECGDNETKIVDICGDCAWSVHSCMCEGVGTYSSDNSETSTSLREQSELLDLEIEVFSSEPGIGFQEHFLFKQGKEFLNECVDYSEMYFQDEDDFNLAKEEGFCGTYTWNDVVDGIIKEGGIDNWGCFRI